MTTISFPPHDEFIPVTFKVEGHKKVILLQPSNYDFTYELPENAQLIGTYQVRSRTTDG